MSRTCLSHTLYSDVKAHAWHSTIVTLTQYFRSMTVSSFLHRPWTCLARFCPVRAWLSCSLQSGLKVDYLCSWLITIRKLIILCHLGIFILKQNNYSITSLYQVLHYSLKHYNVQMVSMVSFFQLIEDTHERFVILIFNSYGSDGIKRGRECRPQVELG